MRSGRRSNRNNQRRAPRKNEHRINEEITAPEIRLVGDESGNRGVVSPKEALQIARDEGLDLVEISPKADPPVCKIIDYSKYRYEQKKKKKELRQKQSKVELKEIRFTPNTGDHDFEFKLSHGKKFLEEGNKIKAYVHFVGRTIVFKERGELLLLRFAEALGDLGKVEQMPKLEGRRMIIMISPKSQKVSEKKQKESDG